MPSPLTITKRQLTLTTHRIHTLPVVVLMPHSRCNCRCVMCDIWKANRNGSTLTSADLERHLDDFRRLGVRQVVLSGGEALMHPNLFALCDVLKTLDVKITLLSTGLLMKRLENIIRLYGYSKLRECVQFSHPSIPFAHTTVGSTTGEGGDYRLPGFRKARDDKILFKPKCRNTQIVITAKLKLGQRVKNTGRLAFLSEL